MPRRAHAGFGFLSLTLLASSSLFAPARTGAADHRDGPLISNTATITGNLDLNDLFVFVSPTNSQNSVLILTTGGNGVGFIAPPYFAPGGLYEFRIDNSSPPDSVDDLVFTFIFSNPDSALRQTYGMYFTDLRTGKFGQIAGGVTTVGSSNPAKVGFSPVLGGGKVTAGLFDDPFFFDSLAFPIFVQVVDRKTNGVATPGSLAERTSAFTGIPFPSSPITAIQTARFPVNGFGNSNTLAIVMELPRLRIQSSASNPKLNVWIRSVTPDMKQFDRTAIPAVNTTIVPPPTASFPLPYPDVPITAMFGFQEMFNQFSNPQLDPLFRSLVSQRIQFAYGASAATADKLAATLLPDVMPFDTTNKKQGFNDGLTLTLNGRRLPDDVVDAELNALTEGALKSDRVGNDSVFLNKFPFLGAPLPLHSTLGARGIVGSEIIEP